VKLWLIAIVLAAPALASADTERCTAGIAAAQKGELGRAVVELDGCDAAEAAAALADVQKKLRASQLSALTISTEPSDMTIETDALPGEVMHGGTTVWAKAGTYHVKAATTDGRSVETTVKLGAHSRATVVLTAPPKATGAPKNGNVDFRDEPIDPPHSGPPPAIKHPSLIPCKYDGCDTHSGEVLVDPLARGDEFLPPHPAALRVGLRAGASAAGHAGGSRIGPALALAVRDEAPWEDIDAQRPFEFELRALEWSRRGGDDARFDALGASLGLAKVLADPDSAWLSLGVALHGEVRFGAPMPVHPYGLGGAATLELALRKLPIVVGARYEQGITELMTGVREHAIVVELGVDWRTFHYTY
jgi:hypothetical protein